MTRRSILLSLMLSGMAVLLVVVGTILVRTVALPDAVLTPSPGTGERDRLASVAADRVADRLAQAIRFRTVSRPGGPEDPESFLALHRWLEQTYPAFHAVAERTVVSRFSLMYRWPGDRNCSAAGFISHLDVVPIEEGTLDDWTHPPFAGVVADDAVWGRGAVDTKDNLVLVMEAAEGLAERGFQPDCDLYFLFGHDEEVGGRDGAAVMASILRDRGVAFDWLLDEAGGVQANLDGSAEPPMVTILVSSQGYMTLQLTASADGGHSASGVEDTAVTRLAEAVLAIQRNPMPARLDGVAVSDVRARAAGGSFALKMLAANLWLLRGVAEQQIEARGGRGMLRTTMAATMIDGGTQENVLPQRATAMVNTRVHPRNDIEDVVDWVGSQVDGEVIDVEIVPPADPPTRPVPPDHPAFQSVSTAVADVLGPIRVVPAFGFGGYDGRYFQDHSDAILNFDFMPGDGSYGAHGTDERLDTRYLAHAVVFYQLLMERHGNTP